MPARQRIRREIPRLPRDLWGYGRRLDRFGGRIKKKRVRMSSLLAYLRRQRRRRRKKLQFHHYFRKKPLILKPKNQWVLTISKRKVSRKKVHWGKKHPRRRGTLKKRLF